MWAATVLKLYRAWGKVLGKGKAKRGDGESSCGSLLDECGGVNGIKKFGKVVKYTANMARLSNRYFSKGRSEKRGLKR